MLENIVAYMLATFLILGALGVVTLRNPVHSVLMLIFTFFNATGIFVFLKAEFIAMALLIVYVGAVAVLFLFVVILVNIKESTLRKRAWWYLILSLSLVIVLGTELLFLINKGLVEFNHNIPLENIGNDISSVKQLGKVLYSDYYYVFIIAGLILTVAMIGAVALSVGDNEKPKNQSQDAFLQNKRSAENSVKVVKVENEGGIK